MRGNIVVFASEEEEMIAYIPLFIIALLGCVAAVVAMQYPRERTK